MKKIIIIILLGSYTFANTRTFNNDVNTDLRSGNGVDDWKFVVNSGEGSDNWRTSGILEIRGIGSGGTSLNIISRGDYDFDSYTNRWLLKTKSRLLSVKDINLITKYSEKQDEVSSVSDEVKSRMERKISAKVLSKKLKRKIKFQNYKLEDFEY